MTNSEYQQLVEFLGGQFAAVDRRFGALEGRFDALVHRVDEGFREVLGKLSMRRSLTNRSSARFWSGGWTS